MGPTHRTRIFLCLFALCAVPPIPYASSAGSRGEFESVLELLSEGRLVDARNLAQEAAKRQPTDLRLPEALMLIDLARGSFDDAKATAKTLNESVATTRALSSAETVVAVCEAIRTQKEGVTVDLLLRRGFEALQSQNDVEAARSLFTQAVTLAPTRGAPLYNLAVLSEREKDYPTALKYYAQMLAVEPSSPFRLAAEERISQLEAFHRLHDSGSESEDSRFMEAYSQMLARSSSASSSELLAEIEVLRSSFPKRIEPVLLGASTKLKLGDISGATALLDNYEKTFQNTSSEEQRKLLVALTRELRIIEELRAIDSFVLNGDLEHAIVQLASVIARKPDSEVLGLKYALTLDMAKDYAKCIPLLKSLSRSKDADIAVVATAKLKEVTSGASSVLGWHGEIMPKGLQRASTNGVYLFEADGALMVWVERGTYIIGAENSPDNALSKQTIENNGYYIDKCEVSNEYFARYVAAAKERPPEVPQWGIKADEPVVGVDLASAKAYAAYFGKALPNEHQWEMAARGVVAHKYPWGGAFSSRMCNYCDLSCPLELRWRDKAFDDKSPYLASVTAFFEGAAPSGALQMVGNAAEWTSSTEGQPPGSTEVVIRGGSWKSPVSLMSAVARSSVPAQTRRDDLGFRCVLVP